MINTLIVNDDDLECNCSSITLENLNLSNVSFNAVTLDRFDLVVYKGNKGMKVLKSKFF